MPRPRPHDDHLREQLLGIATDTIARTGTEGLSLRTLAADAGTSTSAVYQLFGSRAALLDAVYLRVLEEFNRTQADAPMREDPIEDLLELARAYRRWALENRNQFLVLVERITPSQKAVAGAAGRAVPVEDRVRRAMDKGALSGPLEQVVLSLWSTVHGYTALEVAGVIAGSDDDFDAVARATQRAWHPATRER
ncbi:TetR/AcrR family transcriptional regulator [[Pseudopropionibacterium] massiliense]|uniref:TetR/AcrR family transcriptional regulator n=1 Tax=[Pseudopropionibacterium] massiliense TaxID=2220000 RepID=UPI0010313267|nr:TetR/AcrR family transcriptional regulator [[Pseudopropionibacterium] massiliense]